MGVSSRDPVLTALKEHFGFSEFRPLQREIVDASLEGLDVVALLPTGAGKSLCYQLPGLLREGLAVVISPLIALMKDQVDGLLENGISAAFLNSTLTEDESRDTWRRLYRGEIKLLYLSPERLLLNGLIETLGKLNLSSVAVDEAHCISSWGHDFRPEYRALRAIRERYPAVPILALTATATGRVVADIKEILALKAPKVFVASFNRPNLSYRVIPRITPLKQILDVISEHPDGSGIIYCLSRARTESVAEALREKKVSAEAYHAGLPSKDRSKIQDRFVMDETRIIVATTAFGMGVDKPDVRFVLHHDLPKNVESYYQETGRAGRDSLPSECVLLYSSSDAAKLRSFIEQLTSLSEKDVAIKQLSKMIQFAEGSECRRISLLRYFGEAYKSHDGEELATCGACDNCLTPRENIDGTEVAQKFLSCVLRIRQQSGFSVGLSHVVDVLMGASTEKIRKWSHQTLSTYGIGKGTGRPDWLYYGRELISQELLRVNTEHFNVVEVTEKGFALLKERSALSLRAPIITSKLTVEKKREQQNRLGGKEYDNSIFEKLRTWRIGVAKKKMLPAYMIFSDATLQAISREKPSSLDSLSTVAGVGEKKLKQYGEEVLNVVKEFVN